MEHETSNLLTFIYFFVGTALGILLGKDIARWWHRINTREKQLTEIADLLKQLVELNGGEVKLTPTEKRIMDLLKFGKKQAAEIIFTQHKSEHLYVPKKVGDLFKEVDAE